MFDSLTGSISQLNVHGMWAIRIYLSSLLLQSSREAMSPHLEYIQAESDTYWEQITHKAEKAFGDIYAYYMAGYILWATH